MNLGLSLNRVELYDLPSLQDTVNVMVRFADAQGLDQSPTTTDWLLGRGWDQTLWGGAETPFPTKEDLDTLFPHLPVWVWRVDGHAGWANSAALALVAPLPEEVEGGEIVRDDDGDPTGILIDNAMWIIEQSGLVDPSQDDLLLATTVAIQECNRLGLTGVHDAGVFFNYLDIYQDVIRETPDRFSLRNYAFIECDDPVSYCGDDRPKLFDAGAEHGLGPLLTVRSAKVFVDGALGSWGAALLEPYTDQPNNTGLMRMTEEETAT